MTTHRPHMGRPSQERYFNGELFDLLNGAYAGMPDGCKTRNAAETMAAQWKKPSGKARIVKWRDRYWVYGA